MALGLSRLGNAALLLLAFLERGGCLEVSWTKTAVQAKKAHEIQTSFFTACVDKDSA